MSTAAWYIDGQKIGQLFCNMYLQRSKLAEALMVKEALGLMSYRMHSIF